MPTERGTVQVDYKTTGLDMMSKSANIITGINQGLELMRKGLDAAGKATKTFIDTGSQFERYNVQFKTLLGTMDAAQTRMEELFSFATRTPFDLPEVVEAAQKLEAYGIYSEAALRDVGDAAAAMGKTLEQGVEAIADASRGELERLKEFGISSASLTARMGHEINRGTVEGLKEVQDTVLSIFQERYGGGMEALSQTLGGMISNLRGRWIEFKKEVADSGAFQTVKDIVAAITRSMDRLFDSGDASRLAQVVGDTIANAMLSATKAMLQVAIAVYELARDIRGPAEWAGQAAGDTGGFLKKLFGWGGISPGDYYKNKPASTPTPDDEVLVFLRDLLAQIGTIKVGGGGAGGAPGLGLAGESAGAGRNWAGAPSLDGGDTGWEAVQEKRIELSQTEIDQAYNVIEAWNNVHTSLMRGRDQYYSYVSKATQKWGSLEKATMRDVTRAMKEGGQVALASWIDIQGQKAGLRAMEEAAEAIAAYASGNIPGGIGHTAAAAGFMALGTAASIASGMVMKGVGSNYEAGADYGGEGAGDTGGTRSRTVSKTAGITTQTLTINMHIYHQGPTFYGDGGARDFWEETLLPLAQESLDFGALGA